MKLEHNSPTVHVQQMNYPFNIMIKRRLSNTSSRSSKNLPDHLKDQLFKIIKSNSLAIKIHINLFHVLESLKNISTFLINTDTCILLISSTNCKLTNQ